MASAETISIRGMSDSRKGDATLFQKRGKRPSGDYFEKKGSVPLLAQIIARGCLSTVRNLTRPAQQHNVC